MATILMWYISSVKNSTSQALNILHMKARTCAFFIWCRQFPC
nr:MAG TPA: hypothetical protein [Caudoviricetes sp.]